MASQTQKASLVSLHRYFIWADRMRKHFDAVLNKHPGGGVSTTDLFGINLYMSYWYAALYVVIEGWEELKLADPEIDQRLTSPNVQLLRRYRNGVFHFQAAYDDDRFVKFIAEGEQPVAWVRGIHQAFDAYFLREVPKLGISP